MQAQRSARVSRPGRNVRPKVSPLVRRRIGAVTQLETFDLLFRRGRETLAERGEKI